MPLNDEQLDRYARHLVLHEIGGAGQNKICASHVALIGMGGIGCPALQYCAAAGVGAITIIDDDIVSLSNLQRQILYSDDDIDKPKVEAAQIAAQKINSDVKINALQMRISEEHRESAPFLEGVDAIIDGSDNFHTRLIVNDICHNMHIPLVSAAIGQFHGQIGTFYGWQDNAPCYRCFVGDAHDPDDCDNCAEQGVLGAMVGLMGSFAAMEAIRVLTGFGQSQIGKLQIFDGLKPAMRTINLPKDKACTTCSY